MAVAAVPLLALIFMFGGGHDWSVLLLVPVSPALLVFGMLVTMDEAVICQPLGFSCQGGLWYDIAAGATFALLCVGWFWLIGRMIDQGIVFCRQTTAPLAANKQAAT